MGYIKRNKATVTTKQNLIDLAIQEFGTPEAIFDLIDLNPELNLNIDSVLNSHVTDEIFADNDNIELLELVKKFKLNKDVIVNEDIFPLTDGLGLPENFSYMVENSETINGTSAITFNWDAVEGANYYIVGYRLTSDGSWVYSESVFSTSFLLDGVVNGDYDFSVQAGDQFGISDSVVLLDQDIMFTNPSLMDGGKWILNSANADLYEVDGFNPLIIHQDPLASLSAGFVTLAESENQGLIVPAEYKNIDQTVYMVVREAATRSILMGHFNLGAGSAIFRANAFLRNRFYTTVSSTDAIISNTMNSDWMLVGYTLKNESALGVGDFVQEFFIKTAAASISISSKSVEMAQNSPADNLVFGSVGELANYDGGFDVAILGFKNVYLDATGKQDLIDELNLDLTGSGISI